MAMTKTVSSLRELAELAYGGQRPSLSPKRAALLSHAADELERLTAALKRIRDSGNCVHPMGAALIAIAVDTIGPCSSDEPSSEP
jgi:hypothetical protein